MFHESTDLLGPNGNDLWNLVYDFKNKGYVKKIGVSVYTPEVLIDIIKQYKIDIVQMPLNILDQRFVFLLKELKSNNIEIHTRSTFLQGLLLMADCDINPYFDEIRPLLNQIPNPKLDYALQFVNNIRDVDKIIVGTRGWNLSDSDNADKMIKRENNRFELSIQDGIKKYGNDKEIIAFIHYPPITDNNKDSLFIHTMKKYGIKQCYYAHLHGNSHKDAIEGEYDGINFKLVSADYLNFDVLKL